MYPHGSTYEIKYLHTTYVVLGIFIAAVEPFFKIKQRLQHATSVHNRSFWISRSLTLATSTVYASSILLKPFMLQGGSLSGESKVVLNNIAAFHDSTPIPILCGGTLAYISHETFSGIHQVQAPRHEIKNKQRKKGLYRWLSARICTYVYSRLALIPADACVGIGS
ncbi:hypothetical protein F4819DRAFT_106926 [Hypoxylon fuscum]|nr:hypothetical protein F4819DRAFT_106926 [Hypoxylon fuscum]